MGERPVSLDFILPVSQTLQGVCCWEITFLGSPKALGWGRCSPPPPVRRYLLPTLVPRRLRTDSEGGASVGPGSLGLWAFTLVCCSGDRCLSGEGNAGTAPATSRRPSCELSGSVENTNRRVQWLSSTETGVRMNSQPLLGLFSAASSWNRRE